MELAGVTGSALHDDLREAAREGATKVDAHGAVHVLRHDDVERLAAEIERGDLDAELGEDIALDDEETAA